MTRIVLVGAGSVEFTRNLLGDILSSPALGREHRPPRHRPRPARDRRADGPLDRRGAGRDARRSRPISTAARRSAGPTSSSTRSRSAVPEPRRSTSTCPPASASVHDRRHDRRRWRVPWPAHDPGRPRHRPRHGRGVPGRLAPQLHQPAGDARPGGGRAQPAQDGRPVPLGLLDGRHGSPATWACRATRSRRSAGVNHLAFLLRLEHRGRDLYPDLAAFVEAGRAPTTTSSAPTCSSASAPT